MQSAKIKDSPPAFRETSVKATDRKWQRNGDLSAVGESTEWYSSCGTVRGSSGQDKRATVCSGNLTSGGISAGTGLSTIKKQETLRVH